MPFERHYLSFERHHLSFERHYLSFRICLREGGRHEGPKRQKRRKWGRTVRVRSGRRRGIRDRRSVSWRAFLVCSNGHVSLAVGRERGPESPLWRDLPGPGCRKVLFLCRNPFFKSCAQTGLAQDYKLSDWLIDNR